MRHIGLRDAADSTNAHGYYASPVFVIVAFYVFLLFGHVLFASLINCCEFSPIRRIIVSYPMSFRENEKQKTRVSRQMILQNINQALQNHTKMYILENVLLKQF